MPVNPIHLRIPSVLLGTIGAFLFACLLSGTDLGWYIWRNKTIHATYQLTSCHHCLHLDGYCGYYGISRKEVYIMRLKSHMVTTTLMTAVLITPRLAFAETSDVAKVQSFIQSVITILVTFAGLLSVAFFVWGGVGYIISTGRPESLDRSKRTIIYSALGLVICLGAYVLSNLVADVAKGAFGR